MRFFAVPLLASLLLVRGAGPAPVALAGVAVAPAEPAEALAEPAPAPLLPPPTATPLRETGAPVPVDISYTVHPGKSGAWQVQLRRRGHLVALRHGEARTAGEHEATLALGESEGRDAEPVVWETTKLDTLATVRGLLRVGAEDRPGLRLVEAPVPAGRAEGRLHTCVAHEDGAGGFAVLCSVRAHATAANVTGGEAGADVWAAHHAEGSVVRMDLPASPAGFGARVMGYSAGIEGVLVRAEASRAAGEERPSLSLAAAERAQPQIPRVSVRRYICCFDP